MPPSLSPDDLKSLLPAQVQTVLSTQAPAFDDRLPAAEHDAAVKMNAGRRIEFMHGRVCARAALSALGFRDQAIPVGANREPVWPAGVVGSISHCENVAAAVAARNDELDGIGIDLELAESLDTDILKMVCRESELAWLRRADDGFQLAKLIFSAKESLYKSIWPTLRYFVDFQDIGIRLDPETHSFATFEWAKHLPDAVIGRIRGNYRLRDGWIITTACLPRAGR